MDTSRASRTAKPYRGVVVPMITPITPEGDLDEPAVRRVIDHLVAGGLDGIFVLGTTGEAASLSYPMRSRLVAIMVEQVGGRAVTYAGISDNCLAHSVEAAETYSRLGADVVVAHLPSYYALDADEQSDYYDALIGRIPGLLMLYNIPSTTGMSIPVEVVERLSKHPRIIGLKDSQGDVSRLQVVMERLGGRPDFAVLIGVTALSARALALGADGTVPSVGNLIPKSCQTLYECGTQGDAEKYQQQLDAVTDIYRGKRTLAQSLGALKAAMGALGLCGPDVLPPLRRLDPAQQEGVRRAFREWQDGQGRAEATGQNQGS